MPSLIAAVISMLIFSAITDFHMPLSAGVSDYADTDAADINMLRRLRRLRFDALIIC